MASPPRKPVPSGLGSRLEAIEALDRVSNAHLPARRNAPQQSHHAYKSDAAWGQPYGAPQALHHDAPTSPSRMPRVSQPLRVEPPPDFNAPARVQRLKGAGARSSADIMMLSSKLARRPMVGAPTARARPDKIRDYDMRAAACQRAGRQSRAAHLVFNQGVLYENMGEDEVALRCYKDLLRASLDAGDAVGEALACNCIGVTIQLRGGADAMREAIKYHQQHLAVADVPGKFIAHCNLGLAYHALNMIEEATINHQHALRYAIRMSSLAGESLACGHLGLLGSAADAATSKACTHRQLDLATTLHDHKGQEDAFLQLGGLAQAQGEYREAHEYFEKAFHEAQGHQDTETANLARLSLGVTDGSREFDEFIKGMAAA